MVGLAFAPESSADQFQYLTYLDNNGVYYRSMTAAMDMGKQACSIGRSAASTEEMTNRWSTLTSSFGYVAKEGDIIVHSAINYLCDDVIVRSHQLALAEKVARGEDTSQY